MRTELARAMNRSVFGIPQRRLPRGHLLILVALAITLTIPAFATASGQCNQGCADTDTYLGNNALPSHDDGSNTAIGSNSLYSLGGGVENTAVGSDALKYNDGSHNTAVGVDAAGYGFGSYNTAIGDEALSANNVAQWVNCSGTVRSYDTAVGASALQFDCDGFDNTAVGYEAIYGDPVNFATGSYNTGIGFEALRNNVAYDNTAVGYQALQGNATTLSSGSNNTAIGFQAASSYTTGGSNTASGYDALYFDTSGSFNTATGRGALYHNTTANNNVATGYQALNSNKTGTANTAIGTQALQFDTGSDNTADGYQTLNKNTSGIGNTAIGYEALFSNTTNGNNTAAGSLCLFNNTGNANTAYGQSALYNNSTGGNNTAVGSAALYANSTGSNNIAIGGAAAFSLTVGSNNIDIGNTGSAGESATIRVGTSGTQTNTYIAGISGVTVAGGVGVIIDSSGHLGISTSSARFKENIRPMDKASEVILSLEPVSFRYKKDLDPTAIPQFGLVAEQVEKVDPALVSRDRDGKPYSVRYEAVNAMLLNEFLKEHRKVEEQEKKIEAVTSMLAKVSAEVGLLRGLSPTANNQ